MGLSSGDGFPIGSVGVGSIHIRSAGDGLILVNIGGNPSLESSWRAIGGVTDGDPDTSDWGTDQEGAYWYDRSLDVLRTWDGSAIVSVGLAASWEAFTPTGSWDTNVTYTGQFRQIGDTLEVRVNVALSGAPNAVLLTINLPMGETIDVLKVPGFAEASYGTATIDDDSSGIVHIATVQHNSTTSVKLQVHSAVATHVFLQDLTSTVPQVFAADDSVIVEFSVPVE